MNIIILDGYALNPGDLSYDCLRQFGELTIYDRTAPEEVIERAKDADALLTNKVVLAYAISACKPRVTMWSMWRQPVATASPSPIAPPIAPTRWHRW